MALGGSDEALDRWRRTGQLFEAALAKKPDDPDRQRNVALVEKYVGSVLDDRDEDEAALVHYRRALELDEKRLVTSRDNRLVQFDVSIDLANVATIAETLNDLATAAAMYTRSLELRKQLSDSDPKDMLARGRLGYVQTRLAGVERRSGDTRSAGVHARAAVQNQEGVLAATADPITRRDLASALVEFGQAEKSLAQRESACAAFRRALGLLQAAGAETIGNVPYYVAEATREAAACDRPEREH